MKIFNVPAAATLLHLQLEHSAVELIHKRAGMFDVLLKNDGLLMCKKPAVPQFKG